ncbi:gp53-like domain-containing protein [Phascolarctobacterium succinatutens]|uniref:gp53-like domain-containing protein n=1 Tax=Phascolarctobacterium succinatutens TaxID=626940 RepID=UPI003C6DCEA1
MFKVIGDLSFVVLDGKLCVFSLPIFRQDKILIYSVIIHFFPFYALCWAVLDLQWGVITCTTGREGEFIFPISFTTKCLSFIASASIPVNRCTITTAKFTAHDMNYGVQYKDDVFGLFIGI